MITYSLPMPLSREAFEHALQSGHGRALAHVRQFGCHDREDLLFFACVESLAYDPQCEPGRGIWLAEMLHAHGSAELIASVLAALATTDDSYARDQLCTIAACLGQQGNANAADCLRQRLLQSDTNDGFWNGDALIRLDGLNAVLPMAQQAGRYLENEPDEWVPRLDCLLKARPTELAEAYARLQENADDPHIQRYLAFLEAYKQKTDQPPKPAELRAAEARAQYSLERILADADSNRLGLGAYFIFGQYASKNELQSVLEHLLKASTDRHIINLLSVFNRVEIPYISPELLALRHHANPKVRWRLFRTLRHTKASTLRSLALEYLARPDWPEQNAEALCLLEHNFEPGDEACILARLPALTLDNDTRHALCMILLDIAEQRPDQPLKPLLDYVYEATPCSTCRESAVRQLLERNALDSEQRAECLLDGNPDIVELVS